MLKKIAIGTANFTQPYGVLSSENKSLDKTEIQSIMNSAQNAGIKTFDTAFGYGDFLKILPKDFSFNSSHIITKFSALDAYDETIVKLKMHYDEYGLVYEGLLIHDPQNLHRADVKGLSRFFETVKEKGYVKKIGVSVYDLNEVGSFKNIINPDMIQIPFNPLNQAFRNTDFVDYIQDNNVEVHARSLFLQGVLLSDKAPALLENLTPLLEKFDSISKDYASKIETLLMWANAQSFVQKWVLGIASLDNINTLISQAKNVQQLDDKNIFACFVGNTNTMVDPRKWSTN